MDALNTLSQIPAGVFFALYIWSVLWKGIALWRSAKLEQKNWFVAVLILNTFGILEIVYLFFFAKKKLKLEELKFWENK
jgi:methionyl-tRNA synthetase